MDAHTIINIEDSVLGAIHQVTIESSGSRHHVRINGTILPYDHEFTKRAIALYLSYTDHFAGITDLDSHILESS